MSTQPIWFDSAEAGAPVLNNAAGSLVEVLRACLVNGFGAKAITSISVTAGVATATCAAHGFTDAYGKLLLIAGVGEPLLNGRKQPSNVTTNSFDFPAPGVADGTYTGSISARRAPLGWAEAHSGTNKAIFARTVPEATAAMLRVLDTAAAPASATAARVFAVETATDVDTFTGQTPTNTQLSGGQYWQKGGGTATAKKWYLAGDELRFFLFVESSTLQAIYIPHFFGDLISVRGVDAFCAAVHGNWADSPISYQTSGGLFFNNASNSTFSGAAAVMRPSSQIGSALLAAIRGGLSNTVPGGATYPVAANAGNDIVIQRDLLVAEQDSINRYPVRGVMPGLAIPWAQQPYTHGQVVSSLQQEERTYLAIALAGQGDNGMCLIDLTGPWS